MLAAHFWITTLAIPPQPNKIWKCCFPQGYIEFTSLEEEEKHRRMRREHKFPGEYVCGVYYQTVYEPGNHREGATASNVCAYESEGKDLQMFGSEGEYLFRRIRRVPLATKQHMQWHEVHQIYKELHRKKDASESEGPET
ncbi:hypothetical protein HOLleu_02810 [Holothuria leucospilota]|uniref:Uncharacterized protein n=1 Tax=Holothuria leucospilota TaxID=206669 RepID=A0A9Q1CSX8_HOLLE|nr:hypothetical protein HOLleu_02810 [Holothuria leucospilota]